MNQIVFVKIVHKMFTCLSKILEIVGMIEIGLCPPLSALDSMMASTKN